MTVVMDPAVTSPLTEVTEAGMKGVTSGGTLSWGEGHTDRRKPSSENYVYP